MATIILERNQALDNKMIPIPNRIAKELNSRKSQAKGMENTDGYKTLRHLTDTTYNSKGNQINTKSENNVHSPQIQYIPYTEMVRIKSRMNKIPNKQKSQEYYLLGGSQFEDFLDDEISRNQLAVKNQLAMKKSMDNSVKPSGPAKSPTKPSRTSNGNVYTEAKKKRGKKRKQNRIGLPIGGLFTLTKSFDGDIYEI